MIKIYKDGSTQEFKFKIKKLSPRKRNKNERYIVHFVDYPTVIGTGRTTVAAFIEAKKNLEVYLDYLQETGQTRCCLVETKAADGLVVRQWHDMSKTTVRDMVKKVKDNQKKGIVMNIVTFGR